MKKALLLIFSIITLSCAQNPKKQFKKETLKSTFLNLNGETISLQELIHKNLGKTVVIDIWASWCGDCIQGMPKVKSIQKKYPKAEYVFISLDRSENAWKRGIQRYNVIGDHYFAPGGFKSDFAKNDKIGWIPTYILVAPDGTVSYRAKKANHSKFLKILNNTYYNEK